MQRVAYAILVMLLGGAFTCPGQAPRPLRMAAEVWPPFEYVKDGKATGINVDIIETAMQRIGVPVQFDFYAFARSWMLLQKGKVDALPDISYQPERDGLIYFTEDQKAFNSTGRIPEDRLWVAEYVWFVKRPYEKAIQFESYEQLKNAGYRIGVIRNYSYNREFKEAGLTTQVFSTTIDGFKGLRDGKIDLLPMEQTVGLHVLGDLGLRGGFTYLSPPLFSKPYVTGFSKKSDYPDIENVWKRFNAEVRKMRESGEFESIRQQYVGSCYTETLPRPLTFVCEEWAPFEYVANGALKGIDVEVTAWIMERLGVPYTISLYPWARAWMMAQTGHADAVLSISYKEARDDVLYYTEEQRQFAVTGEIPPDYLWMSEYVFFVKKNLAHVYRFDSYDQVKADGLRVGRNKDYSYDPEFLAAGFSGRVFPETKDGLLALVAEEIDLYPMDRTVGLAALHDMGLQESVTWLPKPLFKKPYLAPFCRRSDLPHLEEIMMDFNRELRLMRSSGKYQEIYDRYFKSLNGAAAASTP